MVFRVILRLCELPKDPIKIKVLYHEGIANINHAVMLSVRQTPANGLLSRRGGGGGCQQTDFIFKIIKQL